MSEEAEQTGGGGNLTDDATAQVPEFLKDPLKLLGAALLAVGGLVTFVAAVGGAIIWVRFYAARLPADQALAAMPRGELVASGAVMLAAFVMLGALAVVGVYVFQARILDKKAPSSPGVVRGLLALATAELVVVIALAVGTDQLRRLVAAELVVLFSLLVLLVIRWRESLIGGELAVDREDPKDHSPPRIVEVVQAWFRKKKKEDPISRAGWALGWLVGLTLPAALVLEAIARVAPDPSDDLLLAEAIILSATLVLSLAFIVLRWVATGLPRPARMSEADVEREDEATRTLKRVTKFLVFSLTFVGVAAAAFVMKELWLAFSMAAAILLGIAAWRIARRADYEFVRCGIAVFVSVPLLGAVVGISRNLDDPQVQPVALIRTDDGETEALQGIYVTETDDRVYFGTVATDGCSGDIESGSGRLLWVPREQVAGMLLGPPQSVQAAGERAQEMYYALTPAAANPYAALDQPPAAVAAERARKGQRRLESLGPALRRDFDLAADVDPPSARPWQPARLRHDGDSEPPGVGDARLRVGSVEAEGTAGEGRLGWRARDGRDELEFVVPPNAATGPVTLECGEPVTQPVVRVRRRPRARVVLTLGAGTPEALLDASRSTDVGGRIRTWRWSFDGRRTDSRRLLRSTLEIHDGLYEVGLRVIDDEDDTDAVNVWIGRLALPRRVSAADTTLTALSDDDVLSRIQGELRAGGTLVLHGHGGEDPWTGERVADEVQRAEAELRGLLEPTEPARPVEVRTLVLGERCPAPVRAGAPPGAARIDVFVLGPGGRVELPPGCRPQEL